MYSKYILYNLFKKQCEYHSIFYYLRKIEYIIFLFFLKLIKNKLCSQNTLYITY